MNLCWLIPHTNGNQIQPLEAETEGFFLDLRVQVGFFCGVQVSGYEIPWQMQNWSSAACTRSKMCFLSPSPPTHLDALHMGYEPCTGWLRTLAMHIHLLSAHCLIRVTGRVSGPSLCGDTQIPTVFIHKCNTPGHLPDCCNTISQV